MGLKRVVIIAETVVVILIQGVTIAITVLRVKIAIMGRIVMSHKTTKSNYEEY